MKLFIIHNIADQIRKANIEQQFSNQIVQPGYEIIPAIMDYDCARCGISKSHRLCIQKAKDQGLPWVMIAEDDLTFLNHNSLGMFMIMFYKFRDYAELNNVEWNMFMSSVYEGDLDPQVHEPVYEQSGKLSWGNMEVCRVEGKISGLTLYVVNQNFYDRFLIADEQINIDYEVSVTYKAKIFCISPFVCIQGNFPSANLNNMEEINGRLGLKYKLIQKEPEI